MSEIKDVVCNVCEEYRASIICLKCRKPTCLNCIIIETIKHWSKYDGLGEKRGRNKCIKCVEGEKKEEEKKTQEQEKAQKEKGEFCQWFLPKFVLSGIFLIFLCFIYFNNHK